MQYVNVEIKTMSSYKSLFLTVMGNSLHTQVLWGIDSFVKILLEGFEDSKGSRTLVFLVFYVYVLTYREHFHRYHLI